jgi:hypothetical protein
MLQRWRISPSNASGVVRTVVMNKCLTLVVPFRVVLVVISSTIQALPGQASLM